MKEGQFFLFVDLLARPFGLWKSLICLCVSVCMCVSYKPRTLKNFSCSLWGIFFTLPSRLSIFREILLSFLSFFLQFSFLWTSHKFIAPRQARNEICYDCFSINRINVYLENLLWNKFELLSFRSANNLNWNVHIFIFSSN